MTFNLDAGKRRRIGGWAVFALLIVAIADALLHALTPLAVVLAWLALLLLLPDVSRGQRWLIAALAAAGVALYGVARMRSHAADFAPALTQNIPLISMLLGVGLLRLPTLVEKDRGGPLPGGPGALWRTAAGSHLFGGFINVSAMVIIADRLRSDDALDPHNMRLVSRSFASAAIWSPFFVAMATVTIYVPGVELARVMTFGIPLGAVAVTLAALCALIEGDRTPGYRGYPFNRTGLILPVALALAVGAAHQAAPAVSIVSLIALAATVISLSVTTFRAGPGRTVRLLGQHVERQMPLSRNELSLFLAAAVFSHGLATVITTAPLALPFSGFDGVSAAVLLTVIVLLAVVGFHPIIAISAFSPLIMTLDPDPNLLASTYLASWTVGVGLSPMSGQHLLIQGRYGISTLRMVWGNRYYGAILLVVCILALNLFY